MTSSGVLARSDWTRSDLWGPARRGRWGLVDAARAFAVLLLLNALIAAGVMLWARAHPDEFTDAIAYSPVVLGAGWLALWSVFFGYPWYLTCVKGRRSLAEDFGWRFARTDALVGVFLGLGLRAADYASSQVAGRLMNMQDADNSTWLLLPRPAWVTGLFVLGAAVVGPAAEELFFRGLVLRSIHRQRRVPRRWRVPVAVASSSLIFGLLHTTAANAGGLYVMCTTAALGAVLAVLAVRTRRLGPCVATHVVFNTTGVLLVLLAG